MKKWQKIIAAAVAVLMMLSLTGCTDLLTSYMDYYETYQGDPNGYYSDYAENPYGSIDDSGMMDGPQSGGQGGGQTITLSSNVLREAVRDQFTNIKGNGRDTVTVMIYMCASNLESENGLATEDIKEMMRATENSKLNIVIETGGTRKWHNSTISSSTNQIHVISGGKLTTVEDRLGRVSMTKAGNLEDFITYSAENYPANRYMLVLWDHGAGSVSGWGYDEYDSMDTLTIDELGEALYNTGVKFDFIGFDACLMSTMEVACVLYDFADYMIASEDYESGYGWEYQPWLTALAENTSIPTPELGKIICDDFVKESGSSAAIMATVDLSYMKLVYTAWKDFAYAAEDQLLDANFSWETENQGGRYGLEDLFNAFFSTSTDIQDMLAIARSVDDVPESDPLISALTNAIIYCAANSQDSHMTGMAVTLPYGNTSVYNDLKIVFGNAGFEEEYINYLGKYTSVGSSASSLYDWSDWYSDWGGWDDYSDWDSWDDYSDYGYDDYGWGDWSGWEEYNSADNGWSEYDYYDYFFGGDSYGEGYGDSSDYLYDFFDYYGYGDSSDYGYYDSYDYYGNDYGYSDDYNGYDMWDLFDAFFGS
ncbi:MAG: hypothetical protein E7559_07845 [Ruminococcaceae bacterium]|nr:hypothetical protein [Oscillospiraceae bacterium]